MKKTTKILISLFIFLILVIPAISFAQTWEGLVPCGKAGKPACEFNDIMGLIDGIIKFVLYKLVVPIAAIMFAYAGFLMVTGGGEAASARTRAKSIFTDALIGLIIAMAAFLIIKLILSILGYTGPMYLQ